MSVRNMVPQATATALAERLAIEVTWLDWTAALAAFAFGFGVALWVTTLWRSSLSQGTLKEQYTAFRTLLLFVIGGTIASSVQGLATTPEAGVFSFAAYVFGLGLGFVVGWRYVNGQRSLARSWTRQRYQVDGERPSDLEVFSLSTLRGPDEAQRLAGFSNEVFANAFCRGAEEALPHLRQATDDQKKIFMRVFAGDPIAAIARELGQSPPQVAREFAQLMMAPDAAPPR